MLFATIALVALLTGAAAGWISERIGSWRPLPLQAATALEEQAKPVPPFSLVDDSGKVFDNSRLAGRWTFMFFGYTHCPDICPTTLSILDEAHRSIGKRGMGANTQVAFVSVDPKRDTPGKLKEYVDYFNPEFVGVTGNQPALNELTRALGILHSKVPNPSGGAYLMDHSASILLIAPSGELVALFSAPHKPDLLVRDFHKLRDYYDRG
jgi:protein SCO1/2